MKRLPKSLSKKQLTDLQEFINELTELSKTISIKKLSKINELLDRMKDASEKFEAAGLVIKTITAYLKLTKGLKIRKVVKSFVSDVQYFVKSAAKIPTDVLQNTYVIFDDAVKCVYGVIAEISKIGTKVRTPIPGKMWFIAWMFTQEVTKMISLSNRIDLKRIRQADKRYTTALGFIQNTVKMLSKIGEYKFQAFQFSRQLTKFALAAHVYILKSRMVPQDSMMGARDRYGAALACINATMAEMDKIKIDIPDPRKVVENVMSIGTVANAFVDGAKNISLEKLEEAKGIYFGALDTVNLISRFLDSKISTPDISGIDEFPTAIEMIVGAIAGTKPLTEEQIESVKNAGTIYKLITSVWSDTPPPADATKNLNTVINNVGELESAIKLLPDEKATESAINSVNGVKRVIKTLALVGTSMLVFAILAPLVIIALPLASLMVLGVIAFMVPVSLFLLTGLLLSVMPISLITMNYVLLIGSLVLVGLGIIVLGMMKIDGDKARSNVNAIVSTCMEIIESIFTNPFTTEKSGVVHDLGLIASVLGTGLVKVLAGVMGAAFLVTSVISMAAILLLGGMINLLSLFTVHNEKANENVTKIMTTCKQIVDQVFATDPTNQQKASSEREGLIGAVSTVGKGVMTVVESILGVAYLFTMVIAILLVMAIGGLINLLSSFEVNDQAARDNVTRIMTFCSEVTSLMFAPDQSPDVRTNKSWLSKLFDVFHYAEDLVEAILNVGKMAILLASIGLVYAVGKTINDLAGLDINTQGASANVTNILTSASTIAHVISESDFDCDFDDQIDTLEDFQEYLESIQETANQMTGLDNAVESLSTTSAQTFKSVIDGWCDRFSAPDSLNKYIKSMSRLKEAVEDLNGAVTTDGVNRSKRLLETYDEYLNKVDSVDLEKLKIADSMLGRWANITEGINGNFKALAEALNENIAPALENLTDVMEQVKGIAFPDADTTTKDAKNATQPNQGIYNTNNNPTTTPHPTSRTTTTTAPKTGNRYQVVFAEIKRV